MTLNYFSRHGQSNTRRYDAVNTVRVWMWGKPYLPKDVVRALQYLIPELERGEPGPTDDAPAGD